MMLGVKGGGMAGPMFGGGRLGSLFVEERW